MARKSESSILQEELYAPSVASAREELDDARLVDLDIDKESPFLRAQKRVSARRSSLPKKTATRLLWAFLALAFLGMAALCVGAVYEYGEHSWRFRVESSDNIEVTGMQNVSKAQIMEVMGADIGRNIFFIPLAQQKTQLEQIPWVESASVMRFVPNRLTVEIHERTPIAFARVGPRIFLIDAGGTLMELPPKHKYSFPVILGMNPGEPLSTRAPRMRAYNELVQELDAGGAHYSQDLSEVDLSDLENVKVRVNDPAGDVLVELGSADFLRRYKTYVSHVREWRQQFQKLESVNLRYDNQVIVNPDMEGRPKQAALSTSAARAAAAAGVKPAALVSHINPRNVPKPAFELTEKRLESTSAQKPAFKAKVRRAKLVKASTPRRAVRRPVGNKATAPARSATHRVEPKKATSLASSAVVRPAASTQANARTASPVMAKPTIPKPSAAIAKPQANGNSQE